MPEISTGYWKAMKMPSQAASSGFMASRSLPSNSTSPWVTWIGLATGQHLRERALARAVRPHDGVHLAGIHLQVDALEDLVVFNFGVQILDFQHGIG